jgi:hypothetical protein
MTTYGKTVIDGLTDEQFSELTAPVRAGFAPGESVAYQIVWRSVDGNHFGGIYTGQIENHLLTIRTYRINLDGSWGAPVMERINPNAIVELAEFVKREF